MNKKFVIEINFKSGDKIHETVWAKDIHKARKAVWKNYRSLSVETGDEIVDLIHYA